MRPKNYERYSDPLTNSYFLRGLSWTEDKRYGLQHISAPASRTMQRVRRQRARSVIAQLLMAAQQASDDADTVVTAFREADRVRHEAGETWANIVTGRAA